MKFEKILLVFIFLIFIVNVRALDYTSLQTATCDSYGACDFMVKDQSNQEKVAFCLNPKIPYLKDVVYSDENNYNSNKSLEINNYSINYFECGLKASYSLLPELRDDSLYDNNGNLKFETLSKSLIIDIQHKVWEYGKEQYCNNYIDESNKGNIEINLGNAKYDEETQKYTVDYTVVSKNLKPGTSVTVSTNIGLLSKTDGSGTLVIEKKDLSKVQYKLKVSASAQILSAISHDITSSFKVLTSTDKQELGIPTLNRKINAMYSKETVSDELIFENVKPSEKNIKISKKDITSEKEVPGAHICVYEYDTENNKKSENPYKCFESKENPYEFTILPGDYILEETITPKGYDKVQTGFIFTISEEYEIILKETKSKLIKIDDQGDTIILYNTPIKEVTVADTFKNAKIIYIFSSFAFILIGFGFLFIKKYRKNY